MSLLPACPTCLQPALLALVLLLAGAARAAIKAPEEGEWRRTRPGWGLQRTPALPALVCSGVLGGRCAAPRAAAAMPGP